MFSLLPKIIAYKSFRNFGFPRILPVSYTVSLLYSCNSRCKTCNIYNKTAKNLGLEEYEKIFSSLGKSPYWITFSGGEPFLRHDIDKICKKAYKICSPAIINIPSNGILTDTIVDKVTEIARNCPKSQIIINLSIDAVGKAHDQIRNVPKNYEKVTETFKRLKNLSFPNLSIGIHTVISRFNVDDFAKIATGLMELKPDSYITEIAEQRVELDTMGRDITPSLLSYKSAIDFLIHRIKQGRFAGMGKITQAFRIEYYNLVKETLRDETQKIPCYAGIASAQITPEGDVWACCVRGESLGNLRENDYSFSKIWFGEKMREMRRSIKAKECFCPLANAAYTNMMLDFPTLFRVFWRSFIRWWT